MNQRYGDSLYQPNVGGFYELNRAEYRADDFPKQYEGRLVKILVGGLKRLAVLQYRIVIMMREPEEIRQSHEAFFGGFRSPKFLKRYEAQMTEAIAQMRKRRDMVTVDVLQYRNVVNCPLAHFEALAARGWPIDAAAAAAMVDPKLCRFRLEELTIDI